MLLRRPSTFRRLWVGQFVSTIGDGMQRLALLWWAGHRGGHGLLAAVALSTMIPTIVCSPFGGWLADHVERRRLLVGADLVRLTLSVGLAVTLVGTAAPAAAICAVIALSSAATAVFDPTYAAAVPTVVDDDDLPAANGLDMANGAVGGLVGPLAGGALIAATGIGWVMVVNAATFAWSAACIVGCRLPHPAGRTDGSSDRSGFTGSARAVGAVSGLGRLVVLTSLLNMVVAPVPMMIAALALERFRADAATFGVLGMMLSAGLLVGSIGAGVWSGRGLTLPFVALGTCLVAAGSLPFAGASAALVLAGLAIAVANVEVMTRFQRSVPPELQGRVFGALGSVAEGLRPAGVVASAPLLAVAGVSGAFAAIGLGVAVSTLALRPDRRAARPAPCGDPTEPPPPSVSRVRRRGSR